MEKGKKFPFLRAALVSLLGLSLGCLYLYYPANADGPKGFKERVVYYKTADGKNARKFYYEGSWYFSFGGHKWYSQDGKPLPSGFDLRSWIEVDSRQLHKAFSNLESEYNYSREGKALTDSDPALSAEKPTPK